LSGGFYPLGKAYSGNRLILQRQTDGPSRQRRIQDAGGFTSFTTEGWAGRWNDDLV